MTKQKIEDVSASQLSMEGGAEKMEEPITVTKCTCNKCGHSWIPRTEETPTTCANPDCRSPNWNRQRQLIPCSDENAKQ